MTLNHGTGQLPRISVVVPTCRRPALLRLCLDALQAQTLPGTSYEIVVVDDGRTDDARALCEACAADHPSGPAMRYLRTHGTRGPASARNLGWRAARGKLIAFTDDDTVPEEDWLLQGALAMAIQPDWVAASGHVHVPLPRALTDHARNTAGLENEVFVTANAFVLRSALVEVGGFDERYSRAWREDTDLYFALIQRWPGGVAPVPEARVQHPVRDVGFLASVGREANMVFDPLLFKKYPALYDRHVGLRRPAPDYLAIVIATVAAPLAWPFTPGGGAFAATGALVLILDLARRRLRGLAKSPREVADVLISSFAIPYVSLYWRLVGALRWRVLFI